MTQMKGKLREFIERWSHEPVFGKDVSELEAEAGARRNTIYELKKLVNEAKKEFPDPVLLQIKWDNKEGWVVPPHMPYPDGALWDLVNWFKKWFGDE